MRRSSGSDVPGFVMMWLRKSRSLNVGDQRLAEERYDGESGRRGDSHDDVRPPRSVDHPRQNRGVAALERPHGERVAVVERGRWRGRIRLSAGVIVRRDEERREHRQAVGEHERPEERARRGCAEGRRESGRR